MIVSNEKELGQAVKNNTDTIEIEGDLARKVIRIKATGKVAWGVAIAGLAVGVTAAIVTADSAGTSAPVTAPVACGATSPGIESLGGIDIASAAFFIALSGGGIGILNKLRNYKLEKKGENKVLLLRK